MRPVRRCNTREYGTIAVRAFVAHGGPEPTTTTSRVLHVHAQRKQPPSNQLIRSSQLERLTDPLVEHRLVDLGAVCLDLGLIREEEPLFQDLQVNVGPT